jgi:hypothetical protein
MVWGLGVGGVSVVIAIALSLGGDQAAALFALLFALFCAACVFVGARRLRDTSVKLALTTEGIEDYRTGTLLPWGDIRAMQLQETGLIPQLVTGVYSPSYALRVAVADDLGKREIKINLNNLDQAPGVIEEVVRETWQLIVSHPHQAAHQLRTRPRIKSTDPSRRRRRKP